MKRILSRLVVIAVAGIGIGAGVAAPASAGVYAVYPSRAACEAVGQANTGVLWNYYVCYESTGGGGGWALWAPGY
jgi:hypothetical protein